MSGAARKLAPRQAEVLAFIRGEVAAGRGFPAHRAIADHMGWVCDTSSRDVCMRLVAMGAIEIAHQERNGRIMVRRFRLVEGCGDGRRHGETDLPHVQIDGSIDGPVRPSSQDNVVSGSRLSDAEAQCRSASRETPPMAVHAAVAPRPMRTRGPVLDATILQSANRSPAGWAASSNTPVSDRAAPIPRRLTFDDARTFLETRARCRIPWITRGASLRYQGRAWTVRQLVEEAERLGGAEAMAASRATSAPVPTPLGGRGGGLRR